MNHLTYAVCPKCKKMNRIAVGEGKEPICGACKASIPAHGAVIEADDTTLPLLIQKSPLPVILDVWAPWCGPCRAFAPTFSEASHKFLGRAVFAKLNSDANPQFSNYFHVRSIPTLIVFKNGQEIQRVSGALPREQFEQWIQQYL